MNQSKKLQKYDATYTHYISQRASIIELATNCRIIVPTSLHRNRSKKLSYETYPILYVVSSKTHRRHDTLEGEFELRTCRTEYEGLNLLTPQEFIERMKNMDISYYKYTCKSIEEHQALKTVIPHSGHGTSAFNREFDEYPVIGYSKDAQVWIPSKPNSMIDNDCKEVLDFHAMVKYLITGETPELAPIRKKWKLECHTLYWTDDKKCLMVINDDGDTVTKLSKELVKQIYEEGQK